MNAQRRKQLTELTEKLESIKNDLDCLKDEEQTYLDNMPESFQYGEKGEKTQAAIDSLDYAIDNLQDAVDNINEAI